MKIEVPIRTTSTNAKLGKHWRQLRRIVTAERRAVALVWRMSFRSAAKTLGAVLLAKNEVTVVSLTRVSPRPLDDDNLRGALKAVRDQVAAELGVDDRDPRVEWSYRQIRGGAREYAVRIEIAEGRKPV